MVYTINTDGDLPGITVPPACHNKCCGDENEVLIPHFLGYLQEQQEGRAREKQQPGVMCLLPSTASLIASGLLKGTGKYNLHFPTENADYICFTSRKLSTGTCY